MAISGEQAEVVSVERKRDGDAHVVDVLVDDGNGDTFTVDLFQPPGDDSLPLPGDTALLQESAGSGNKAAVAFNDPANEGKAGNGERRIYSRTAEKKIAADVWLKADGSVHIEVHELTAKVFIKTKGAVIIDSPDIRLGDEQSSRPIACLGDMVSGSIKALSTAPGSPILPAAGAPTPTGGVPFVGKIISGSPRAKAK